MQRIIGESSTLVETLSHVSRVAPVSRPILVVGERGSGKEIIAERLHYLSSRWQETFQKVNCAAISESILDSALFGHEAGAFTGAIKAHIGLFERADGGTLFLDELATMPSRIQEKLLRLIEYGEFERLGGSKTINVDVRIVAATHADLPQLADNGEFRHDLLDRLAFDVIHVPPLRERLDDMTALVNHFASGMSLELEHKHYEGFSKTALQQLANHSWPGNIRELRNVVERSLTHWHDPDTPVDCVIIDPFLTTTKAESSTASNALSTAQTQSEEQPKSFSDAVKSLELLLLKQALEACNHHQQRCADRLGLSYHQLRALLKKYKQELSAD